MNSSPINREGDDSVLQQLSEHGDVGAIPRPVFIWVFGDESDLREVEKRLAQAGWPIIEIDDGDDGWVLKAEREQPATAEAIYLMTDEIVAAIEGTQAIYDGWETSVEKSS